MKLFGLKNCDTCRKATKALREAGREPVFHDLRADGISRAMLDGWAKAEGWQKMVNKSSTTWRNLSEAEKAACTAEGPALDLLEQHPTLIKRPVIDCPEAGISIGWSKETAARLTG